ncbi:hypothetical protein Tco_0380261, partial [Tanacetum coccineum]
AVVGDMLKGLGEGGNPCSLANTEYVGLVIGMVLGVGGYGVRGINLFCEGDGNLGKVGDEGDGNLGKINGVGALGLGKTVVFLSGFIPVEILLIRNLVYDCFLL